MAEYKIPQDVEADDKFLGPLSFKQFIYGGIVASCLYFCFLSIKSGAGFLVVLFAPIILVAGFLAFPWSREQPTEIWLAARFRFLIKPRIRIWNQSGVKELVTITAPKTLPRTYTDGLSVNEVTSRLSGLADLLDSRGWAIKNATSSYTPTPNQTQSTDRLFDLAAPSMSSDASGANDVLDETRNQTAIHFEAMIKDSEQRHRQDVLHKIEYARQPEPTEQSQQQNQADFWFAHKGGHTPGDDAYLAQLANNGQATDPMSAYAANMVTPGAGAQSSNFIPPFEQESSIARPISALDEQALLEKVHKMHDQQKHQNSHLKTIMPLDEQQAQAGQGQAQPAQHLPTHKTSVDEHDMYGSGGTQMSNVATQDDPGNSQANDNNQATGDDHANSQQPTSSTTNGDQPVVPWSPPESYKHRQKQHEHKPKHNQHSKHNNQGQAHPQGQHPNHGAQQVTPPVDPAIISLANNNDLNVATLAREAKRSHDDGEVVISLR